MKPPYGIAVGVGILVAIWVSVSVGVPSLGLITWAGFLAWAAFFAAGAGAAGFQKAVTGGWVGVLGGLLAVWLVGNAGGDLIWLIVLVSLLAAGFVVMAQIGWLDCTPAAFIGAAAFFADGAPVDASVVALLLSWLAGAIFGFASQRAGILLTRSA